MKIGVLTFHFAHNYGAMLQAHALICALEEMGHDVEIINYTPEKLAKEYNINPLTFYKNPKIFVKKIIKFPYRYKQYKLFEQFLNEELKLSKKVTTKQELWNISSNFDSIIVGSDQVWNDIITGNIDTYFLNFVDENTKRISYAASFGTTEISEHIKSCIKEYLMNFYKVSVREVNGVGIINNVADIDVTQVLDPVFLMDESYWSKKIKGISINKDRYILYYSLQDNQELKRLAEKASREIGIPIYSIHPIAGKQSIEGLQLYNVGPLEFMQLVKNAEIVCTNSFHAVAFSVIFKSNILHVSHSNLGSRVESLLKNLGVNMVESYDNYKDLVIYPDTIDYNKLEEMKNESIKYLMKGVE